MPALIGVSLDSRRCRSRQQQARRGHLSGDDPRRAEWLWFLQTEPAPPPNSGMAATLDETMAQLKRRYQQVQGQDVMRQRTLNALSVRS
jgi:hypothetical protein